MQNILNITNGDSSVEIMTKAGIPGVYLPWRDVLHEGPVPNGLSLEALSTSKSTLPGFRTISVFRRFNFLEQITAFDQLEHPLTENYKYAKINISSQPETKINHYKTGVGSAAWRIELAGITTAGQLAGWTALLS